MEQYSYEIKKILKNAEEEMFKLNHPYVGTEHLLLSLLKVDSIKEVTSKYDLTYESFLNELIDVVGKSNIRSKVVLYTPLLRKVIDSAMKDANSKNALLDEKYLFASLLTSDDGIAIRIMLGMDIDIDNLYNEILGSKELVLDKIGTCLNDKEITTLVGRDKEIDNIIEILLRKKKNNPILIGSAGVGKSALVLELANRIKKGLVPRKLRNSKIISLDMATLLSNTKYRGEFETRLNNIINEVKNNKDIILFIDEIHTIVKSGGGEGSIDAANILKPYLASDEIKVIGATTTHEYEKYIASDKALLRRFEKVYVCEPNFEETIHILKSVKHEYERYHGVSISDENIHDIVSLANKYIFTNHNPDKSLDVLDYVCSRVTLKKYNDDINFKCNEFLQNKDYKSALDLRRKKKKFVILKKDILDVIMSITNIKLLTSDDYKKVVDVLDKKIYGQDLSELKNILKKRFVYDKVLGILIKGSAGVGKSYTAKIIAEELGYNLIELDMKDFSNSSSKNRIKGVDVGYQGYDEESILDKIKYHPYSLLLLKNIEYASEDVLNIFKTILNKGSIKNNKGDTVSFDNSLIVMTSDEIKDTVGYNNKQKGKEIVDNVVYYDLINKEEIKKYLIDKKLDESILNDMDDKITFTEVNRVVNDFLYNSKISMI